MKSKKTRVLFILSSVAALLLLILLVQFVVSKTSNRCLNAEDYKDLTKNGTLIADPKANFYTYTMEFSGDEKTASNEETVVSDIASFYNNHHRKSIIINISSINNESVSTSAAVARVNTFANKLTEGGVKESVIKASAPEFFDVDSNASSTVTATIVTSAECRQ